VSPVIFLLSAETKLCRLGRHCPRCWKGIGANVCVCAVVGFRSRHCPRGQTL